MRIAVVGGGVVGLCCAREFRRSGAEVTVVERGRCGGAASLGNAGWIVPSYSAPIPAPGVIEQSLKWMLDPNSPFRIRPRLAPELVGWLWKFRKSCTRQHFEEGLRALLALNEHTMKLFDGLRAEGVEFEMHTTGLLVVALSAAGLEAAVEEHHEVEKAGYEGKTTLLDGEAARRLEPALSDKVAGALHLESERYVRPESIMGGLKENLAAAGVEILENTEVVRLAQSGGHKWLVSTSQGELEADRVLISAGVWSAKLLADLRVRVPLEGARGCSITAGGPGTPPSHALKLEEARVTCSPFEDGVRITGTLDLTGLDDTLDRRRLGMVIQASKPYLRDWRPEKPALKWAGLRPLTPDSLPLIGAAPSLKHLYVATGHGQLGVTLAPATAAAIAPLVLEDQPVPKLEPFRLDRF
ncbi:MAG: FAD-dependent oxidoreductase [Rubrobacteraceae bacterium]